MKSLMFLFLFSIFYNIAVICPPPMQRLNLDGLAKEDYADGDGDISAARKQGDYKLDRRQKDFPVNSGEDDRIVKLQEIYAALVASVSQFETMPNVDKNQRNFKNLCRCVHRFGQMHMSDVVANKTVKDGREQDRQSNHFNGSLLPMLRKMAGRNNFEIDDIPFPLFRSTATTPESASRSRASCNPSVSTTPQQAPIISSEPVTSQGHLASNFRPETPCARVMTAKPSEAVLSDGEDKF